MTTPLPSIPDEELVRKAFRFDHEGYQRFLALEESDRISEFPTDRGPVVVVDGKKIHSGRDPAREAMRFVRGLNIAEATSLLLYGYGSGYVARAIAKKTDAIIFVYEPCLEALRWGITHGEIPERVVFLTSPIAVKTVLYAQLGAGDRGQLIPWQPSVRIDNGQFVEVRQELEMAVHRAKIRALTAELRGDGWLNFFLQNLPRILEGPSLGTFHEAFKGVPAVVCSAGPSLTKQLPLLKTVADDVLIL
ncbi:MAG: 6-hydroxymethylpterin diphosphokinase MptE-like protein, partial [Nannocystaceae bacterium]